ncbi:oligoendopeptidase F [Candidatus Peregrinibacteria bacterium]|nr:oligoendopeptidase F [Candidatus Peregrinibacteria bacterium]
MTKKNIATKTEKHYYDSRKNVPVEHRWKLEKMYKSHTDWEKHFKQTEKLIAPLAKYKGKLKSPKIILDFFENVSSVQRPIEKLYVYASHLSSIDLSDHQPQILVQKAQNLYTKFAETVSFQGPELVKIPDGQIKKMIASPSFKGYHRELQAILLKKKHILSDAEEALLSSTSQLFSGPEDIYSALDNVDLDYGEVEGPDGKPMKITSGTYINIMEDNDRSFRERGFTKYYQAYKSHIHTYAQTLNLAVKQHAFYSKAKKYNSSLHAALSNNLIDTKVYTTLIEQVHAGLKPLYKYFAYRAKKLGLKKINMWDMRVSLFAATPMSFTYDQAVQMCLEAVKPLGTEYVEALRQGLTSGWVDKFENKGKRSGAYSGGCYDSDPYIMMNFTGRLNDVYTLIHEAGHSMHSYLSRSNQPYSLADYPIFTAEIASTVNERLLTAYLLKTYQDDARLAVIAYEIDAIRATYFRQTMFAEFELLIHQAVEKGQPLTASYFNQEYNKLNTLYNGGPNLAKDEYIQYEWARIPHFYFNFYVYQYATGIAAAFYFAEKILDSKNGPNEAKKYLDFLKSGGNDFPLKQLKRAGIDFTKPEIYQAVVKNLNKCLNLLQ